MEIYVKLSLISTFFLVINHDFYHVSLHPHRGFKHGNGLPHKFGRTFNI